MRILCLGTPRSRWRMTTPHRWSLQFLVSGIPGFVQSSADGDGELTCDRSPIAFLSVPSRLRQFTRPRRIFVAVWGFSLLVPMKG